MTEALGTMTQAPGELGVTSQRPEHMETEATDQTRPCVRGGEATGEGPTLLDSLGHSAQGTQAMGASCFPLPGSRKPPPQEDAPQLCPKTQSHRKYCFPAPAEHLRPQGGRASPPNRATAPACWSAQGQVPTCSSGRCAQTRYCDMDTQHCPQTQVVGPCRAPHAVRGQGAGLGTARLSSRRALAPVRRPS